MDDKQLSAQSFNLPCSVPTGRLAPPSILTPDDSKIAVMYGQTYHSQLASLMRMQLQGSIDELVLDGGFEYGRLHAISGGAGTGKTLVGVVPCLYLCPYLFFRGLRLWTGFSGC